MKRNASAAVVPICLTGLGRALMQHLLELFGLTQLADVLAQGGQLDVQGRAGIDPYVGPIGEEEVDVVDVDRFEAFVNDQPGKRHGVARGGIDGVDSRQGGLAVVDMLNETSVVDDDGGVHGHHGIGPKGANDAHQLLA